MLSGQYQERMSNLVDLPICFLDFDGVLHPDAAFLVPGYGIRMLAPGHELFEWASILEDLLSPHPEIKLVLSTSWVPMRSFSYAKTCLAADLQQRVIGATYHSRAMYSREFMLYSRGEQIHSYVVRHGLRRWCAIDDDSEGWSVQNSPRVILTESSTGLSDRFVQDQLKMIFASL